MRNLVIVPTYNERENIQAVIHKVMGFDGFDLLVVDDNSPDGTADLVERAQLQYTNRLHLLKRAGKLGLGTAYIAGFKFGLKNGYELIYEMDADFSHDPDDLWKLQASCMAGADMSIGSRYTPGGGFENWPRNRILISKGGSAFVRCIMGIPVKDPTAGFVCYKAQTLRAINLDRVEFMGYGFQIEMKYIVWKMGGEIEEVAIIFKDRELGKSKMHIGIIREAVWGVLKLRFRNIRKWYGSKVLA